MFMIRRLIVAALLAGCTEATPAQSRPAPWRASELQGSWTLRLQADPEGAARIRIKPEGGGEGQPLNSQNFTLEIAVRDGAISSCVLSPAAGSAQCRLSGGRLLVETAEGSGAALMFAFNQRTAVGYSGVATMSLPFFGLRQNVGVVTLVRAH